MCVAYARWLVGWLVDHHASAAEYQPVWQHRFNDDGTGRGLAGRDRAARGAGTNVGSGRLIFQCAAGGEAPLADAVPDGVWMNIVGRTEFLRSPTFTPCYPISIPHLVVGAGDGAINAEVAGNDGYVSGFRRSGSREDAGAGRDSGRRSGGGSGKRRGERSSGRRDGGGAGGQKKAKSKSRSQAITDRLTDTSTYTGAHKVRGLLQLRCKRPSRVCAKRQSRVYAPPPFTHDPPTPPLSSHPQHRFDSSGHGRGREGRTEEVEYTGYVAAFDDARDSPVSQCS